MKKILCFLGFHKWVYSLREAQERNLHHVILLDSDKNIPKDLWFCDRCHKRMVA